MTNTPTTISELNNLLSTYFVRKALPTLTNDVVLYRYAEKTPMPKGEGVTAKWNAWSNMAPITGALANNYTNPDANSMSARLVSATIVQYGKVVKITDFVDYTASLNVMEGAVAVQTENAARSLDGILTTAIFKNDLVANGIGRPTSANRILSGWMSATVSAFTSGSHSTSNETWAFPVILGTTAARLSAVGKTAPSTSATAGVYAVKKVVKALNRNNARGFNGNRFVGVCNTDFLNDLTRDPDFKAWNQYTSSLYGEKGVQGQNMPELVVAGVEFYTSNNLSKYRATAHSCDVTFIFGKGAYGVTEFGSGKKGFDIIIKKSGPQDTSNPLSLFATVGYKMNVAAATLNPSAGRTLITHAKV